MGSHCTFVKGFIWLLDTALGRYMSLFTGVWQLNQEVKSAAV